MTRTSVAGIPVIAVSGWAFGAAAVRPLAAALPPGAPFTALASAELQEFASDGSELEFADSLSRRIAATGRPAVLAGWSLGALIALDAAIRAPRQVAALVLVSATARFCRAPGYPAGTPATLVEAMIARLATNPGEVLSAFIERTFLPDPVEACAPSARVDSASGSDRELLLRGLRYLAATDLREKLHGVACPTLILHGDRDRIIPVAAAGWLHRRLPSSRLEVFSGAGHALPLCRRDELCERIGAFLRGNQPA